MRTLILLVVIAGLCFTQTLDTRPAFEAASLKPSSDSFRMFGGPGTPDPGRWTCTNTLDNLLLKAYNIRPYQLSTPAWMASDRFTIMAKLPAGTTGEQFRLMQQRLLEERFHITSHREKKELPVYELVVLPSGAKVTEYVESATARESEPPVPASGIDSGGYPLVSEERTKELLAIDEVLTRLQERDARIEEIGNCRFFGGPLWCRPSPSHFRRPWQCAWDAVQWWLSKELKPLNHPQEVPADGAVAI